MSRRKITTTVYMEPEEFAFLKSLSTKTHVPMAVYVRQAVATLLAQHGYVVLTDSAVAPAPSDGGFDAR